MEMLPDNDLSLFEEVKTGSNKAFKLLFYKYYNSLCAFAEIILNDSGSAEDVVQQCFISLWEKRDQVFIRKSLKSYLFQVVKNLSLNHERKARKISPAADIKEVSNNLCPESTFLTEELYHHFDMAINELPIQIGKIYRMRFYDRMKQRDIASVLDIPESTVEKHMMRASKHVRKFLSSYLDNSNVRYN